MQLPSPEHSRRNFIAASASILGTSTFANLRAVASPSKDRFGGWPIGIQSFSLRKFSVDESIRHMQGLGIHFVEFYRKHVPLESTPRELGKLSATLRAAGIQMSSHGVNRFTNDHAANRNVFEFAERAGLKNITANPTPDAFDSLDQLVAEYDIRVCIHNHGPGAPYDKIDDVVNAVKDHDPRIGACVDTGHFIRSKEDPIEAVTRLGDRVFALHIKDEESQEKKSRNVIIGSGFLDVAKLFQTLKSVNFPADGSISLEYEANADNPIDDIQQCLAVAEEAIGRAAN